MVGMEGFGKSAFAAFGDLSIDFGDLFSSRENPCHYQWIGRRWLACQLGRLRVKGLGEAYS